MLYAPHFQLRAFDTLTEPARLEALAHLLEALTLVNVAWLREQPDAPWLYESGVRYEEEPPGRDEWQDIPETIKRREGDCEDLACWRLAELRVRSLEDARPFVKCSVYGPRTVYHVAVRRSDGRIEDPSRVLGMR
ncbi:MAG TPA: hypothetical protein VMT93_02170 [Gemmatimonadaceae bacterium]|nr:hypothetical protein [Gemmatimonadaceae bacterium]